MKKLIGSHVLWKKTEGKPNVHLTNDTGFGCLDALELGRGLAISGDYGLLTTQVTGIVVDELSEEGVVVKVTTQNSVYWITGW